MLRPLNLKKKTAKSDIPLTHMASKQLPINFRIDSNTLILANITSLSSSSKFLIVLTFSDLFLFLIGKIFMAVLKLRLALCQF